MLPIPSIAQLSSFSGRPIAAYSNTTFANSALLQATLMFLAQSQNDIGDWPTLGTGSGWQAADAQQLAILGICDMADYIYLRQPYQQVIASPLMNETVGSYSYGKAMGEVARNAAALEVQGERSGRPFYDLAMQMLAKRTRAGGVYFGQTIVFEEPTFRYDHTEVLIRDSDGAMVLLGPSDIDQYDFPFFDRNTEVFPQDPGIG